MSKNDDIEYWFSTDSGAHIPVRKGQTKEQALAEFLKSKGDPLGLSAEELKRQQSERIYYTDEYSSLPSAKRIADRIPDEVFAHHGIVPYDRNGPPYQPQAFASAVRQRLLTEHNPELRKRLQEYLDDVKHEPQISSDMRAIADSIGSDLLGYEFRLKNAVGERFYQKIAQEPTKRNKDNVRYTMRLGDSVDSYHQTAAALKRKGYKLLAIKNYWLSGGYYKGINTQWESPDGTQFEVQFHSEHNLAVKEELHPLYEQWRKEPPDSPKARELEARQYEIAKKFQPPKNIDTVK